MEQEYRGRRQSEPAPRERREQSTGRKIHKTKRRRVSGRFVLLTVVLIALTTALMFAGIFAFYVKNVLGPELYIDADGFSQKLTSTILYQDDNGEWQELQKLYGLENRKPIDIEDLPDHVWQAVVAIEDQRFFDHHGVDWLRTAKATMMVVFTGDSSFGGSTLTQQLIKNLTDDRQDTIKRKVMEIFRALELEKHYDKDEILEMYLNQVYFGSSSYGIGAAAETYFGKEASELSIAEAACIIGITNNPSRYNPLNENDGWSREQNQNRQRTIIDKMVELGYISEAEGEAAKAEELNFVKDRATSGNETTSSEGKVYSYMVDQIIADVLSDMQEQLGYSYQTAQSLLFNGGYTIYATVDKDIQQAAETVFEDLNNTPYVSSVTGKQMQAAITIIDPYTGEVKAMVGGVGEKTISRGQNLATVRRPCGSSIKPISTYAPAIDNGTITVGSILDDAPIRKLNDKAWPKNYDSSYAGLTTVQTALEQSLNTAAVRVNEAYGVESSYLFMKEKLGFNLVSDDMNSASLALGGLTRGVTTEEMAAAYSVFVNNGIYTTPHTYLRVEDSKGNPILENTAESWAAVSESTAAYMTELLRGVVTNGNAKGAKLGNVPVAGKTGTTTDNYDRYFVGMTPYYVGAVWCGYEYNESIRTGGTNPAVSLWQKVMKTVHEGCSWKDFTAKASDTTTVTLCLDSGMLATDACANDVRGSRCRTVTVPAEYAPTEVCTMHVESNGFCTEGQCPATGACPASSVTYGTLLDYSRETYDAEVADQIYCISYQPEGGCPVHGNAAFPDPDEGDDSGDDDDGGSGSGGGFWDPDEELYDPNR